MSRRRQRRLALRARSRTAAAKAARRQARRASAAAAAVALSSVAFSLPASAEAPAGPVKLACQWIGVGLGPVAVSGTLYFVGDDGVHGCELWKSDGTAAGTTMVSDLNPGYYSSGPSDLTAVGSTLYFTAEGQVWRSDGTPTGTTALTGLNPGPYDDEYETDVSDLTAVGDVLYFQADDGIHGHELWKSDGTAAGTSMVADINPGTGESRPEDITAVGNTVYFSADDASSFTDENGEHGRQLWKSDGTAAGTTKLTDLTSDDGYPGSLTAVGNTLYFTDDDGVHGNELWKSDGTADSTVMVKDIYPGTYAYNGGTGLNSGDPLDLTAIGDIVYFQADDGTHGKELWKSDGTASGTTMVADINLGAGAGRPYELTFIGNTLYFGADDGSHGEQLWKSDGSAAGTTMVSDVNPESGGLGVDWPTLGVGSTLYFAADDGIHGNELWKSDGTAAGTVLVKDIYPGTYTYDDAAKPSSGDPNSFTAIGGTLYFAASDGADNEVWKSDGTAAGTMRLADAAGSGGSGPGGSGTDGGSSTTPTQVGPLSPPAVGKLKKGKPITVTVVAPAGSSVSYQWVLTPKKKGHKKPKPKNVGNKGKLKPKKSWKGGKLKVTVTITEPGHLPYTKTLAVKGKIK